MAPIDQALLARKAKFAYEKGRLLRAAKVLAIIVPLVVLSIYYCGAPHASALSGLALAFVSVGLLWRGQGWGRSVAPGLKAGVFAFALPVAAHATGYCCRLDIETALCLVSGVVAGLAVGVPALRAERERMERFIGASMVAALTGSLGCLALGFGGAAGVMVGVAIVTAPLFVVSAARA